MLNRTRVLGTVLVILFLSGSLAANGVQENRVARAKELIAERNYNEAMLILTTVVRQEPDRQDEAQELISEIVKIRNQYNDDYERLINLLYTEKDEAKALTVIAQLEALDKNPNKQVADDIKQAKRSARLIANNKRYRDILARALALLERKEYGAAVQVYLEGSDLAKDMFLESGFGNVLTNQVDRAWEDLKAASTLFVQAEARLKSLPTQGSSLLASEGTSNADLDALLASLKDLASWRQRAWSDGRLFRSQNDLLVKNNRQDDFFLNYSYLFIHGPPEAKSPEGILGAIDRLWAEVLNPWTDQIRSGVEARYTQAKAALDQGRYAEAATAFEGLRVRARQGLEVVTLWNRLAGIDETGALDAEHRARLATVLPLGLWLEHRLTLAVQGLRAVKDLPRGTALIASAPDREGLEAGRIEVRTQKESFGAYAAQATNWTQQTRALGLLGFSLVDPPTFSTAWQSTWAGYRAVALSQESQLIDRRGTWDYGVLDGRFQGLQTALTGANDQVEGKVRFPLQATARLEELRPLQDTLAKDVGAFIGLYEGEPQEVKTQAVQRWPVRGRDLLTRVTDAQTLQGQLLATAKANYSQSQVIKKQGQDLVAPINTAILAENFTLARSSLNQMTTRFTQSLALQEDAVFRANSDIQVKELFDLILKGENEVVVREVRKLITQGSEAYLAQQFQQAEQVLLRARSRWATTNTDPNSEVEYWLTLANYALSVTTGRELSPIDPLYNEVQQLLNFARRDYTLGQELLTAGQKTTGLERMTLAKEILSKILLPFPLNQEARLLNLEILKASDPENFPTLFKQSFDAAVAKIAGDATVAYSDLQDLDKIQPGYLGMAAAIKQVRKKLNLDREAVDPRVVAQARTLVNQATRLVDGGSPNQLATAQTQIRQALQLDPTNRDAQALFDKISLIIKSTVLTLNVTQEGELNQINDLVRASRSLEAQSRMTEFTTKYPGIDAVPKVKELIRRIKALNQ